MSFQWVESTPEQAPQDLSLPLYQVLVVDDDSTIRYNVKEYFTRYHQAPYRLEIDQAATGTDAVEKLKAQKYDLIICDINLPDFDGFEVIKQGMALNPAMKKALITAYNLDEYMRIVKDEKVYNIITKTAPFNYEELATVVNNLLIPESAFGLEKYMKPDASLSKITVKSSEDITTAQFQLERYFQELQLADAMALTIVMVEAITNAVYHSAVDESGNTKYTKGEVIESLPENHQVFITYGKDSEKLGVSIQDQSGSLSSEEIIFWMERNISGENLMDTHGRGFFLMHRLIDRVVINLSRGKRTELLFIHYFDNEDQVVADKKPIYINEV